MIGGHEGAGVVDAVGDDVTRVEVGDHIVCSFIPVCGKCRFCSTGHQNLCDQGATLITGCLPDGTFRFHRNGEDYGGNCMLGTFAEYGVISEYSCVPVDRLIPFEVAALVACGVPTGWGSAVYVAAVEPGETVIVYGCGGIGSNAVQGAAFAGAQNLIVVDPEPRKREFARSIGATHSVASSDEAETLVKDITRGVGADKAIICMSIVDKQTVDASILAIRKGGSVTITGLVAPGVPNISIASTELTLSDKSIRGALYGSGNPLYEIPKLLELYQAGRLKLQELVTTTYSLDEVDQGYADMHSGRNIRGVITF
jgi:S-(hydroxymethyl)glutathione dehydrogenase/alcohol dehydrogenase